MTRYRYDPELDEVVEVGAKSALGIDRPVVSDSLGCIGEQVAELQADAQLHGFSAVEFKPDPHVPGFYQAHCNSPDQWRRYVEHRGLDDRNSRNGGTATLTPELLERAKELASRGHT